MQSASGNAAAEAKKTEGNNEFKKGNYGSAIALYSQAICKYTR